MTKERRFADVENGEPMSLAGAAGMCAAGMSGLARRIEAENREAEPMTEFAATMQRENNKLLQAMSDDQLVEIVGNCIEELEKRDYSILVSISNPDKTDSAICLELAGMARHIGSSLMCLSMQQESFRDIICKVAKGIVEEKEKYKQIIEEFNKEDCDE